MDCDTYHELIVGDLDGTLSSSERDAVGAHLERCAVCRNARALEAEFAAHLRRGSRLIEPPRDVQARVRAALARAAAEPDSTRPTAMRMLAGAAAVVVVATLLLALARPGASGALDPMTEDYGWAAMGRLPLDLATDDPAELARFFDGSRRFGFSAVVLDLRPAGYRLLGGAIRERRGVVYAVSVYRRGADLVVCHRFRDTEPGGAVAGRFVPRYLRARGLGFWVTRRAGVICCLTSGVPRQQLERGVLALVRRPPGRRATRSAVGC
jgi:anti-sigma factor RsiW